jgi:ubiquinone/menaquinone biosynthesis C-methylase UbiE
MIGTPHGDVGRFDEWAPTYERHWMQRYLFDPVQRTVLDLAAAEIPRPAWILDVGCGTGRLLRAAEARFPEAHLDGVDAAAGMVKVALAGRSPNSRINCQEATAEALPFADGSFDLIFSTVTFHHWHDQERGIAEMARVLKPSGRWLIADFIAAGPMTLLAKLAGGHRFPSRSRFDAMLAVSGLEVKARRPVWRTLGNITVLAVGARAA